MGGRPIKLNRRQLVTSMAAGAAATSASGLYAPANAAAKTGPLAFFTGHVPFVLAQVQKATGGHVTIGGKKYPFEIIIKDSQSTRTAPRK